MRAWEGAASPSSSHYCSARYPRWALLLGSGSICIPFGCSDFGSYRFHLDDCGSSQRTRSTSCCPMLDDIYALRLAKPNACSAFMKPSVPRYRLALYKLLLVYNISLSIDRLGTSSIKLSLRSESRKKSYCDRDEVKNNAFVDCRYKICQGAQHVREFC